MIIRNVNRAQAKTSDFKDALPPITAKAVDDHTVQITTAAPDPILPAELNAIFIMSKRWAEQHDALLPAILGKQLTYAEDHANGTGPFKLVSFAPGVGAAFAQNPDWWGSARTHINLDGLMHRVIKGCRAPPPSAPARVDGGFSVQG